MAGIIATGATRPMSGGETSANGSSSGYVVAEQITLSTTPTGTTYAWSITIPTDASAARCALSDDDASSVTFIPNVGGMYTASCTVDGSTTYTLVLSVTDLVVSTPHEALRLQKVSADGSVPAPSAGALGVFVSEATGGLVQKDEDERVIPLKPGTVGNAIADADATIQVGDGVHRVVKENTLTDNRAITLGTTSATTGHIIEIHRLDANAYTLAVINGGVGAGTLVTLPVSECHSCEFRFDGTNWALAARRKLV